MKKILEKTSLLFLLVIMANCMRVKQVGKLNMISNRNVESKVDYVSLRNYMGGSKKELKKLKAETIEQAIDNVVRNTPGGEFLKNVKIFLINSKYYAVEGDVWGLVTEQNFKGFKIGDEVQWKEGGKTHKGIVVDLKNEEKATIREKEKESEILKQVKYVDLLKTQYGDAK